MAKYVIREGTVRGEGRYLGRAAEEWKESQRDAFVTDVDVASLRRYARKLGGRVVRLRLRQQRGSR